MIKLCSLYFPPTPCPLGLNVFLLPVSQRQKKKSLYSVTSVGSSEAPFTTGQAGERSIGTIVIPLMIKPQVAKAYRFQ